MMSTGGGAKHSGRIYPEGECWEAIACCFSTGTTCGTVIVCSWSSQAQPWVRIACVDLKTKGVWARLPEILIKPVQRWFWVP